MPSFRAPAPMRFSLDGVPERERPLLLRESFGREYELEPVRDAPLDVDLEFLALPGLMVMSGKEHGLRAMRSRKTLAADASDDIAMVVNLGGPLRITHGRQELALVDGEAALVSLGEVCSFIHRPPGNLLNLRVPRQQIAPLVTGVDDLYCRPIRESTPALRLLIDYVKVAQDEQRIARPELQHLVVKHVHDLMALAIGATQDDVEPARGGGLRAARLHAIKQDIAKNIDQPDLSVVTLAGRHGCTERFVQRLFEEQGTTFTEYVLAQRLARAYRRLTDPRGEGEKISVVAWDSGFGDVSYFNRAFRRRYGLTPSDIRAKAHA